MKPIDGDALIAWIKESQHMTSKMKNVICKIETMPSMGRPQGIYDAIALVNKETEREDLSDEIRKYLFCDLRKKLWGLDSRPQAEWIPCSERLPEEKEVVAIVIKQWDTSEIKKGITYRVDHNLWVGFGRHNEACVWWLPLPLWKGADDE